MKVIQFIARFLIFSILSGIVVTAIAYYNSQQVMRAGLTNNQVESNGPHLREGQQYDLLIMGISHARMLSRMENHQSMEQILNKKIINIGMGGNLSDIALQRFYLEYFFHKNNRTKEVMIVMSPPMMMNESLSLSTNSFFEEPFSYDFFFQYIKYNHGNNRRMRTFYYIKSKMDKYWLNFPPKNVPNRNHIGLTKVDSQQVAEGMKHAYDSKQPLLVLEKNKLEIHHIINDCKERGVQVSLIITPTLFGKWQYHEYVANFCKEMQVRYGVRYFDYSESLSEPQYYYDHHHLNAKGVIHFATYSLLPVFK